ncbi:F-box domain protein [Aspergillus candidus]|uniref:F-box domain protein n=1 Tax=Aspergillus candidus TaxID=41067 RepID=A0A2I2FDF5_ASPCN|nr:F-box domain protein [Aspergillus candidus]PLB38673.1 F-box domain protein [Aspergillus candidus]
MDRPRNVNDLADELISEVLSFLLGSEQLLNDSVVARDADLAPGLDPNSVSAYGEQTELDRFRLVCRRFTRIGTPRKFPRFVLRFSREGFGRLEDLLSMQLACHVRYFTYMVRPFYQGSGWSNLLNGVDSGTLPDARIHQRRFHDQCEILDKDHDVSVLRRALAAFTSLQQVKLLRLQDKADEKALDYIRERTLGRDTSLDWGAACSRAVSSLGISLLESTRHGVRFVGPQISPDATVRLSQTPSTTLSELGTRLTSLDVTFLTTSDMTAPMGSLSSVFHDFFLAARNLTAIHLGFPPGIPLDLSLETIFHRLQWKRLRTLSIQGWRLHAEELISLISRHRRPLRDIRLTSIYLREGSYWRDVLSTLHSGLDHLERIDLRDINYVQPAHATNTSTNGSSSSNGTTNGSTPETYPHPPLIPIITRPASESPPPQTALSVDHMSFLPRGNTRRSFSGPTLERLRGLSADELGDDGVCVRRDQRLFWEAWVLSSSGGHDGWG